MTVIRSTSELIDYVLDFRLTDGDDNDLGAYADFVGRDHVEAVYHRFNEIETEENKALAMTLCWLDGYITGQNEVIGMLNRLGQE